MSTPASAPPRTFGSLLAASGAETGFVFVAGLRRREHAELDEQLSHAPLDVLPTLRGGCVTLPTPPAPLPDGHKPDTCALGRGAYPGRMLTAISVRVRGSLSRSARDR